MFKTEQELMDELMDRVHSGKKAETAKPLIVESKIKEIANVRSYDEQAKLESLVESIFSGNVDSDDSEKDESEDESKDEEKDESNEEEAEEESDGDEEGESEEEEAEEEGEESDGDSDDNSGFGGSKGGPFTSKIRSLQKQYNDLLVDAFEKYAPECIEDALDETESAFGENIEDILQNALDKLKAKIMGDLGVEGSTDIEGMMPPAAMGGFDPAAGADKPMEIAIDKVG